jgi:hypothetical protein
VNLTGLAEPAGLVSAGFATVIDELGAAERSRTRSAVKERSEGARARSLRAAEAVASNATMETAIERHASTQVRVRIDSG